MMQTLQVQVRRISEQRVSPPSAVTLRHFLVLACGLAVNFKLIFVGEIYWAELMLPLLVLPWIPARGGVPLMAERRFLMLMLALLFTLLGYLLSDLIQGTREDQYLRGWGRILLLISDVACLALVCAKDKNNFLWFALGIGLGHLLLALFEGHAFAENWKFDYAKPIVLILVAMGAFIPSRMLALLLAGVGVASMFLDFRSLSAICLALTAYLVNSASFRSAKLRRRWRVTVGLVVALGLALGLVLWLNAATRTTEDLTQRREQSNAGRLAGWDVGLYAIAKSPIIGWGSWSENRELAQYYSKRAQQYYQGRNNMASGTGSFFAPHSQILQAWVEGGILGAAFFIVLLWQLLTGLHVTIMSRTYDALSAVFAYVLLLQLWDLFMSPFGGDHRMEIAMAVVAVVLLRIHWPERRQVRSTKPDRIRVDPVAPNSAVRQLRGAVVR